MSLFNFKKNRAAAATTRGGQNNTAELAELALNNIADGVVIVDQRGVIQFANPAAAEMTGYDSPASIVGLDYQLVIKLENTEGAPIANDENKLAQALIANRAMTTRDYLLVAAQSGRKMAVALTLVPASGLHADRIITFRDITKELEEAGAQTEFISTASHEMRTPVASIEGYLGLALNPQTATIDARARQYLEAAHASSQHLGHLFKDLLDVTKLDDGRLRVHLVPVEIVSVVREMANAREKDMMPKHLKYSFGTTGAVNNGTQLEPLVYAAVDLDFLREILDNLIENAIKYTPDGGEIWVNARGDGDKVLINVTDTGIGVAADDLAHIFQKFYRVDNSQTRQIGGTGLGLYLVKQRVEAMNGRVWCESSFGDGSTFFVSLPRLTDQEYEKMRLAYENEQAVKAFANTGNAIGLPNIQASGAINSGAVQPSAQPDVPDQTTQQPAATPVAQQQPASGPTVQATTTASEPTTSTTTETQAPAAPVVISTPVPAPAPVSTKESTPAAAPEKPELVVAPEKPILPPPPAPPIPPSAPTLPPAPVATADTSASAMNQTSSQNNATPIISSAQVSDDIMNQSKEA